MLIVAGLLAVTVLGSETMSAVAVVLGPTATPTLVPTATATARPTSTPTPTPTVTPTPTPTLTVEERVSQILERTHEPWAERRWDEVIRLVEEALAIIPDDAELEEKLRAAHFNWAVELIPGGDLEGALDHFDQALALEPDDPLVNREREALAAYLTGLRAYEQQDWPRAIQHLSTVYDMDAGYLQVRQLLYDAHLQQGRRLEEKGDLQSARDEYGLALQFDAEGAEAGVEWERLTALLTPPTPTPTPAPPSNKWIEVDISEQRFRAWESETLVYDFIASTGEPGRDTAPGKYRIQSKIPNAYSSIWNLWMPYWMGIYWVGSVENGIHALPILSSGQTLWAGYLGTRVSFGCVILDTKDAEKVYNWAEIGTPVVIHY